MSERESKVDRVREKEREYKRDIVEQRKNCSLMENESDRVIRSEKGKRRQFLE